MRMPTSGSSANAAGDADGPLSRRHRRLRTWGIVGIAALGVAIAAAIVYGTGHHDDLHTPIGAIPLVSETKVVYTFEESPIAHGFTYVRWVVIVGGGSRSSRMLANEQRYQLIYDDWRDVTPPRAPGTYAALSPGREFRLALLTTREDALARPKRLFVPVRVLRVLRRPGLARRPVLVVQIDRNVRSPVS